MQIDQSMNKGHMNFFLCCAGAHDLGHDFCVARIKNHFSDMQQSLQTMNIPRSEEA